MTTSRERAAARRRRRFFEAGAAALKAIDVPAQGGYACPLCLTVFSVEALDAKVLTLEHVPPESIGGKEITLTCVRCNSTAGAGPDAAMHRRQVVEDFWRGHGGELVMKLSMGGHDVSVTVERRGSDGGLSVTARPEHTNPTAQAGWEQYLESQAARGGPWGDLSLKARWYDAWQAAVGDLRAAYLAAFAKLGYSYILKRELDAVRAQLEKPKERILPLMQIPRPGAAPDARTLVACDTPVPCLVVQLGPRLVILPWPPSGVDPYAAIKAQFSQGQLLPFNGGVVEWPTGMELALDVRSASP